MQLCGWLPEQWKSAPCCASKLVPGTAAAPHATNARVRDRSAGARPEQIQASESGHRSKARGSTVPSLGRCVKELRGEIFRMEDMRLG